MSLESLCFLCNFESPWALHGVGSHAIRTRLCSRNALFCFLSFSENSSQKSPIWGPFWGPFSLTITILWEKRDAKNREEKSARLSRIKNLWSLPGAPWQPPSHARFFKKKQLFQQETTAWAQIAGIVARIIFLSGNVLKIHSRWSDTP